MTARVDPVSAFIDAACVPLGTGHATGALDEAEGILAAHPEVAGASVHTAAVLGDDGAVRRFLELDASNATAKGGPRGWDALTHLCFSRFLRLDRSRSDGFMRAATALLDAGASANTGWFETNHLPHPEWESALYGAAGVARHPELTRLLLEHGADPNDEETPYHAPETYDNRALMVLVESGMLTDDSLATMLLRKHDWHDDDGVAWLLRHGADPNRPTHWGKTAFHNAVLRDNSTRIVELLLDHGGDPTIVAPPPERGDTGSPARSAVAMAARRGRGDLLELFERRGVPIELHGVDRLIGACTRDDAGRVRSIAEREPELVRELVAQGGRLLADFAGNGNAAGVVRLLSLGVDVAARFAEGDGYWDVAKDSTALHVAAWRARHDTVKLLIERGAPLDARDANRRTPVMLAVRACVDSYWADLRSPDSVRALLDAGASTAGVTFPCGYATVDELLERATKRA